MTLNDVIEKMKTYMNGDDYVVLERKEIEKIVAALERQKLAASTSPCQICEYSDCDTCSYAMRN